MAAFWKTILFWKKPKMLSEGQDYRFIDFKDSDITGVELLMPEYLGVVYHYGKARIVDENGFGRLEFGYTLVYPGEHDLDTLNTDSKFHTIMGEILNHIMLAKVEDEARNNNTEKPDLF